MCCVLHSSGSFSFSIRRKHRKHTTSTSPTKVQWLLIVGALCWSPHPASSGKLRCRFSKSWEHPPRSLREEKVAQMMAGETKGSVNCLVIVAANVIVCVTLMRTPWRTEGTALANQARTPAQSANTTSTASSGRSRRQSPPLFHPSSLVRTHLAATAARLVPPSGSSAHHPSLLLQLSSTGRQPIPIRQPSDWTGPLPHCLVGRAVSGRPPEGQGLPISAACRGPRGHERTRIATAQTATPLDAKRDSLSGRDKPCGLGCPWTQASPLDSTLHQSYLWPPRRSLLLRLPVRTNHGTALSSGRWDRHGSWTSGFERPMRRACIRCRLRSEMEKWFSQADLRRPRTARSLQNRRERNPNLLPAAAFCVANRLVSSTTAAGQSPYKEVDRWLLSRSVFPRSLQGFPAPH